MVVVVSTGSVESSESLEEEVVVVSVGFSSVGFSSRQ